MSDLFCQIDKPDFPDFGDVKNHTFEITEAELSRPVLITTIVPAEVLEAQRQQLKIIAVFTFS